MEKLHILEMLNKLNIIPLQNNYLLKKITHHGKIKNGFKSQL